MTVTEWVRKAGLTKEDIPAQLDCFMEESVDEWLSARTLDEAIDAFVDSAFVLHVLTTLGHIDLEMHDKLADMYGDLMRAFPKLSHDDVSAWQTKVLEANFKKFTTSRHLAWHSSIMLAEQGIANYVYPSEDVFVLKSYINQTVNGKFYPKNKILKPIGWSAPQ